MKTQHLVLLGVAAAAVWYFTSRDSYTPRLTPPDDEGQNGFDLDATGSFGGVRFGVSV